MTDTVKMAIHLWKNDCAIVPLRPKSKAPFETGWTERKFENEAEIVTMFEDYDWNLGVRLGADSKNLIDADLDTYIAQQLAPWFLPKTGWKFGRRSAQINHWLWRCDESLGIILYRDPYDDIKFFELRGDSHQTMFPPSIHPDNETLGWAGTGDLSEMALKSLKRQAGLLATGCFLARHWYDWSGQIHFLVLALSGALLREDFNPSEIENLIRAVCVSCDDTGTEMQCRAVRDTADAFDRDEPTTGWPALADIIKPDACLRIREWLEIKTRTNAIDDTDVGNALQMAKYFGRDYRYCPDRSNWIIWNGRRWEWDSKEVRIRQIAIETHYRMMEEARKITDPERRVARMKWVSKAGDANRTSAMISQAKANPDQWARVSDLNRDPMLLNIQNGTFNLETTALWPHRREDLITKIAEVDYNPNAKNAAFERFLMRILPNPAVRHYVHKALGYSITGKQDEQVFFIPYGNTANGKSTLMNAVRSLLGDYGANAAIDTFLVQRNSNSIRSDLARLAGVRFLTTSEIPENGRLNSSLIKSVTGGDVVTSRNPYETEFEYVAAFKLWMPTNHLPRTSIIDEAIWRRNRPVPFEITIPEEERMKDLGVQLALENSAILNWLIEGCRLWQQEGLQSPEEVEILLAEHKSENDNISRFIDDMCDIGEAFRSKRADLHRAYVDWCRDMAEFPIKGEDFYRQLNTIGHHVEKTGHRQVHGLKLRSEMPTFGTALGRLQPEMQA